MLQLDGAAGEGGGQILRTSLTLAAITGKAFRLSNIRGRRRRPGLLHQHLTAVRAAAAICGARLRGDALHSGELCFEPDSVRPGAYHFNVGTAGSAVLVAQTVLLPLCLAGASSTIIVEGGTHNGMAPPFEFLATSYLPRLHDLGYRVSATLERHGFYPAGGGRLRFEVEPPADPAPLNLEQRGQLRRRQAIACVAKLPLHIADRELRVVERELGFSPDECVERTISQTDGPGNVLLLIWEFDAVSTVLCAFGRQGLPAEEVAGAACQEAATYLASEAPVDLHLADQLLLPMALRGGGSFVTQPLSSHSLTSCQVIRHFLDPRISVEPLAGGRHCVRIVPPQNCQ